VARGGRSRRARRAREVRLMSDGLDVAIRDDEGRIKTMVTVTPIDGDTAQAEAVAELVRENYQTTDDVFDEVRDAE